MPTGPADGLEAPFRSGHSVYRLQPGVPESAIATVAISTVAHRPGAQADPKTDAPSAAEPTLRRVSPVPSGETMKRGCLRSQM